MSKRKSVPLKITTKQNRKTAKIPLQKSDNDEYPSWRFKIFDKDGPFPWPSEASKFSEILEYMGNLETMRWGEIKGRNNHTIQKEKLFKAARDRLVKINKDDIDSLFSFRLSGKQRVFCIKNHAIVDVLWYDPNHQVCPCQKKHT